MVNGIYEYGVADYTNPRRANGLPAITWHKMRVKVLSDGPVWAEVQFMEYHADGRVPGCVARVKTRRVKYDGKIVKPIRGHTTKLPYKD